jgi:hypothetical protein
VTTLNKIIRQLGALSDSERLQLLNRLKALQSLGNAETGSDTQFVLGAVGDLLRSHGVEFASPAVLVRQADHQFEGKVPDLMAFLASAHPTRTGQRALLMLALDLLYRDIAERGYPVAAGVLLRHIHRLPATLNRHFPGYARAGMLGWIIDRDRPIAAAE